MRAVIVMLVLLGGVAYADEPTRMTVGVYVNHIYGVDIKNGSFNADFYVWFRWKGNDALKPLDSFELANGRVTSKSGVQKKVIDGENYASCRVLATVQKFWDLRRFPLDDHTLELVLEDSEQDTRTVLYQGDTENSTASPDLQVLGWQISGSHAAVLLHAYATNYGDISLPHNRESHYSRYVFGIDVKRPGYGRFLKVFFGLFISVLISWCGFHVRPKESSPRVSLGVGATFAAAAVTVAINNSLPDTNTVTMADKLIMLTLGIIVASVAETITALALVARGKEDLQKKLDKICAIAFPVLYVVMLVLIIS